MDPCVCIQGRAKIFAQGEDLNGQGEGQSSIRVYSSIMARSMVLGSSARVSLAETATGVAILLARQPGNRLRHSILGPGKGHKGHEGNRAHPRLTRCDLFENGELLWRMGRS